MSRPQTYEQKQLTMVDEIISRITESHKARLELLEGVAAYKSGADVNLYRSALGFDRAETDASTVKKVAQMIQNTHIPFEMAISSLAHEPLTVEEQKKNGVFYTDYRLANMVVDQCRDKLFPHSRVVDLAAGTGILLAGIANRVKERYPEQFSNWIANFLFAYDLAPLALRGAAAAMLSLSKDIQALKNMYINWHVCDSLLANITENSFDIVVGNPPWGKIKLSRHSFLTQNGDQRTYGTDYENYNLKEFEAQRASLLSYSKTIKDKYDLMGTSEPDMYMAFIQRAIQMVNKGGQVSFLVPAGLIRSQGTKKIREYLMNNSSHLSFYLLDNHANYFSIDSRFKFLLLSFEKTEKENSVVNDIMFSICNNEGDTTFKGEQVIFNVEELKQARPDLTIPEVKNTQEAKLFFAVCKGGIPWGIEQGLWETDISREVDMTNDRAKFASQKSDDSVPVIEGRMVQQHRFGAKSYVSGRGRSAVWEPCITNYKAQFYCDQSKLRNIKARINVKRAGYCDIAGQTNERAMMSAIIPENVVCGNKVPTIIFPNDESGDLKYLWVGITNSFVFDWMIRRIISTTVNYFLLFSIPMPNIKMESEIAKKIISLTKKLSVMKDDYYNDEFMAEARAEIDVLSAAAYGLSTEDMHLIMEDFPLLDRLQPPINGEHRSTVTRDLLLSKCEEYFDNKRGFYCERYETARQNNAKAYIPTEMTKFVQQER